MAEYADKRTKRRKRARRGRTIVGVGGLVAALGALAFNPPAASADRKDTTPTDLLDKPRRGADAVGRLGKGIDEAASRNGTNGAELRKLLQEDQTAWLDKGGRVHFVEPAPTNPDGSVNTFSTLAEADTFVLHSRPGASRVIYLDFDGETVSGTAWNASYNAKADFYAAPYDTDGSPATFSANEKSVIRSVWQRVAEDYAPFDVDITTAAPPLAAIDRTGTTDQQFGTRLLVTSTATIYSSCRCGGIAYLSVFGAASNHQYYQPAFVFQKGVGSGAKGIAEAASHEVGHNLGLHHDGTSTIGYYSGQGAWAPIMGVGYSKPITQWSRGEYTGANNKEDDFAIMIANGAPLRADDNGDTLATATALPSQTQLSVSRRIGARTDKDMFRFTSAGGATQLTVSPAPVSPNLDLKLTVYNSAGVVVATVDPASAAVNGDSASGLAASYAATLPAGTYYLEVDGVGVGSPTATGYSDYASVGEYRISGVIR